MVSDTPSSVDAEELYPVVRRAVEDALWNIVGSVFYGLFLVLLGLVGVQLVLFGIYATTSPLTLGVVGLGTLLVAGAGVGLLRLAGVLD